MIACSSSSQADFARVEKVVVERRLLRVERKQGGSMFLDTEKPDKVRHDVADVTTCRTIEVLVHQPAEISLVELQKIPVHG